jgi:hypothetical protein
VLGAALVAAEPAFAAEPSISEQLFLEGKTLMRDKQYTAACEKFKASHDLDLAATGTLLNLALCHEQTNRPATAWAEFRQVAAESSGRPDDRIAAARVALAREHEARLLPLLSHVVVVVRQPAPGLRLTLDAAPIESASWGLALPVDPGKHVLEATAPGKLPRRVEVAVGDTAGEQSIEIPSLAAAPPPPPAPPRADGRRHFRTVAFALGGVGVASLAVGLAFGSRARSQNNAANDLCPDRVCPDSATKDTASADLSSAKSAATVANVLSGVGLAAIAGGVVLFVLGSGGESADDAPLRKTTTPVSSLHLGVGANGLVLAGSLR